MILATIWFILVFVLLGGYVILDGFDLGVGALHLLARGEDERRMSINAIGPVWDGNEVWLLTGGGALFAAFPAVYATAFSGFYIALMLVLAALIFRGVSMEFRGKIDSARWRKVWDISFSVSSILLPVLFGVALGNVLRGLPLAKDGTYSGTFIGLLNPYAVFVGVLSLVSFIMHGAAYLAYKTEAEMSKRYSLIAGMTWIVCVVLLAVATVATKLTNPSLIGEMGIKPIAWVFLGLIIATTIAFPLALRRESSGKAVIVSGAMIGSMMGLAAVGLFPRLLPSITDPQASLTIYNSASSQRTLWAMLVIALIGMPLVIGYTFFIYRAFRGPVVVHKDSY
jgi:cytochrome bd ubiquinol oxidase subunit II